MRVRSEQELALLLCGTTARRDATRTRACELLELVEPDALVRVLDEQRLLPLAMRRLEAIAPDRVPPLVRSAGERARAEAVHAGTAQELLTTRLLETLSAAGIPAVSFKGALAGRAVHGATGLRIGTDVDLLVHPDDLAAAAATLSSCGFEPAEDPDDHGLPLLHRVLVHRGDGLPPVDLHWRVHWYETTFAGEAVRRSVADPLRVRRPLAADELAILLLVFARDGLSGLRLAADLGAWWDAYGDEVEPGALAASIAAHPALAGALASAARCAEELVGLPAAQLLGERPRRLRERVAVRLSDWRGHRSSAQAHATAGLIDGLLTPAGQRRAFVRRQLLTGRGRDVRHALRVMSRYGLALSRAAHRPVRAHVGRAAR